MPSELNQPKTKYQAILREELVNLGNATEADGFKHAYWFLELLTQIQTKSQGHFVYTNQVIDNLTDLMTPPPKQTITVAKGDNVRLLVAIPSFDGAEPMIPANTCGKIRGARHMPTDPEPMVLVDFGNWGAYSVEQSKVELLPVQPVSAKEPTKS
jgi:hypothetical protein